METALKQGIWAKEWFAGACFALLFALLVFGVGGGFGGLERGLYDAGVRGRNLPASNRIAVVAIDEASIASQGRWPWPRSTQAQLIKAIAAGNPRVIVNTALYTEPEQAGAGQAVEVLGRYLADSPLTNSIPAEVQTFGVMLEDLAVRAPAAKNIADAYAQSALATKYASAIEALQAQINALVKGGSSPDADLATALAANGRTLLPVLFTLGAPLGGEDPALATVTPKLELANKQGSSNGAHAITASQMAVPIPALAQAAMGLGHLNITPDPIDGVVRQEALVVDYFGHAMPSLALRAAAAGLNLQPGDLQVRLGSGVYARGYALPTNSSMQMLTQYYSPRGGRPAFVADSASDILSGKLAAEKFKDKIVLVGTTAAGTGASYATPVDAALPPVMLLAHTVSSLVQQQRMVRPDWGLWVELLLFLAIAAFIALAVPRLPVGVAALFTAAIVLALLIGEYTLLTASALWLKLVSLALFAVLGYGFMLLKRFNLVERLKRASESESGESNRMLGLAFQGQGQLDMAFDKFKRVKPVDDKLLDLLYNLALDFERKRQFNKAESVYGYIVSQNPNFKDCAARSARAKKLGDTVMLGSGAHVVTQGGTMLLDGGTESPMLGRYSVEKELGKGAMGVVYLGKDPKIGRSVAIKTMSLANEFEADELEQVKERFFREAETAGRLSHPNIVSIYDAGEEHDLAYIAMELIKGHDLTRYAKPDALLPLRDTLRLMHDAALALDYAHSNNVVHRDIKPANMMLLEDSRVLKLMDFGIARIAGSSKTKTGMVLGTPSYMSPEQLSGKKVDGRSDLFSLGVTTYQLLTGVLPFTADSMATLMFKIANEAYTPILSQNPSLPPELERILSKALEKNAEQRYPRGAAFAEDLGLLLRSMA